jgi:arsenate reductase
MLAFRGAFRALERRLKIFVSLPITQLDRITLTKRVEAIGRLRDHAVERRAL